MSFALSTVVHHGDPTACLELGDRLFPLGATAKLHGIAGLDGGIVDLFHDWAASFGKLSQLVAAIGDAEGGIPADTARLAPLRYPGKVLCAGANYYDHIAEMGVADTRKEAQRLFFFFKPPRNAVVGPGATVRMPIGTEMFDWEVELAAVIGRPARAVSVDHALDHVAAYSVALDLSARDLNRAPETFYKLDWVAGKGHDTCCPLGPRLVPAAFVGDPMDLAIRLSVNGALKQNARTSGMIFSIAEQIATLSRIMTLDPGDVILTGTPAGVGFPKRTFLAVGDRIDATIQSIGTLSVSIAH